MRERHLDIVLIFLSCEEWKAGSTNYQGRGSNNQEEDMSMRKMKLGGLGEVKDHPGDFLGDGNSLTLGPEFCSMYSHRFFYLRVSFFGSYYIYMCTLDYVGTFV